MKPVLRGRWRRPAKAFSTTALALALSCAGALAAQPASAADDPAAPSGTGLSRPETPRPTASDAELRERVAAAVAAEAPTAQTPKKTPFIIGGNETTISSAPWMVQLAYSDPVTGEGTFCGGTLVAPNKVLTAAHCVVGMDWEANGAVVAGATGLLDDVSGTVAGVWAQWNHPGYDSLTNHSDIAVLTLDRPLEQKWLPLASSSDSALYTPGTSGTVYGWGLTSGGGTDLAANLRTATLPLVADSTCDTALRTVLGADYFIESSMICAGTPATGADEGTKSPCNGDSGGPLVVGGKVAGIVSWGVEGCTAAGAYPVFTKVAPYAWAAQPRVDDTDWNFDGRADMLGRTPSGGLFEMDSTGESVTGPAYLGTGWDTLSWMMQADLDRDWLQDMIVRDPADGHLYREYFDHAAGAWQWMQITTVWGGYKQYAVPGDLTGDSRPDLLTLDVDGSVYLYPGKGNGEFFGKTKVVNGAWKGMTLFGRGDFSGDGKADLLVRYPDDTLYLYRGTQNQSAPFATRVQVRTGWNFTAFVANGDVNGDGRADVLARQPDGTMFLYPGTGKANADIFGARKNLGTIYNKFDLLF